MNLREGAAFIILLLSGSAMDSDSQIIPGLLVITTLFILSGQAVHDMRIIKWYITAIILTMAGSLLVAALPI